MSQGPNPSLPRDESNKARKRYDGCYGARSFVRYISIGLSQSEISYSCNTTKTLARSFFVAAQKLDFGLEERTV